MKNEFSPYHVGVAAEAIATALFARCGLDVSVQYGANQPEYDLILARGDKFLKVSVKGSQDGKWGLTQSLMDSAKKADYHGAADRWLERHNSGTVLCFVQFKGVSLDAMPRVYLATPLEIAARLRASARGRGDTVLREHHQWAPRAYAAGVLEEIPAEWRFSAQRVEQLLNKA
jgi:Holliday junction resolvase-like predicted endonuclease